MPVVYISLARWGCHARLTSVSENQTKSQVRIWKKAGKKWLDFKKKHVDFGAGKEQHKHVDARLAWGYLTA